MTDASLEAGGSTQPASSGVICVVLAAGSSRRMGERNKLLEVVDDVPLVVSAVRAALASNADEVLVVTGEDHERLEACLAGLPVQLLWNPDHAEGLSTSLKVGASAIPPNARAVVVCLGDMPLVHAVHIDSLIRAFTAHPDSSIFVPTSNGRRGNPVLWTVDLLPEVGTIAGDVGCRALMSRHPVKVREVPMDEPGILTDVDTPGDLRALTESAEARS